MIDLGWVLVVNAYLASRFRHAHQRSYKRWFSYKKLTKSRYSVKSLYLCSQNDKVLSETFDFAKSMCFFLIYTPYTTTWFYYWPRIWLYKLGQYRRPNTAILTSCLVKYPRRFFLSYKELAAVLQKNLTLTSIWYRTDENDTQTIHNDLPLFVLQCQFSPLRQMTGSDLSILRVRLCNTQRETSLTSIRASVGQSPGGFFCRL